MAAFPFIKVIFASLLTLLFAWAIPQKVIPSKRSSISPFPTITISPFLSVMPTGGVSSDTSFIYPNATVTNNQDGLQTLISTDDPGQITRWYEDKINESQMHSTSVSQTNSNSNILNVLDALSDFQEVKVSIARPAGEQNTTINLRIISK